MAKLHVQTYESTATAREHYLSEVDRVTPHASPAVTALREAKWREVLAGEGPLLEAEAAALHVSIQEAASRITQARQTWCVSVAACEGARIRAKERIRQADAPAQMHRALMDYRTVLESVHSDF